LKPVLTDIRGPYTVVIFAGGNASASCISGPSFTAVSASRDGRVSGSVSSSVSNGAAGNGAPATGAPATGTTGNSPRDSSSLTVGGGGSGPTSAPAGRVVLGGLFTTERDGHPYTLVEGHTGAGVIATTLVLDDGNRVQASTANGWFAAWWPGAQRVTAIDIATPSGTTTQHFDTHGPVLCGHGPCTRTSPDLARSR
jgi:hypothetical protein